MSQIDFYMGWLFGSEKKFILLELCKDILIYIQQMMKKNIDRKSNFAPRTLNERRRSFGRAAKQECRG